MEDSSLRKSKGTGRGGSSVIVPWRQGLRVLQWCRRALWLSRARRLSLSGNRGIGRFGSAILSNIGNARVESCQDSYKHAWGFQTSFLATGFSSNERCVNLENFASTSRSASSAKLLEVSIRVVRFGKEFGSVGCRLLTRFLASSSVRKRGESGKLERAVISLSVKSMASWSYTLLLSHVRLSMRVSKG